MKKLASLLMSLLVCVCLLPGQACAADAPDPVDPPVYVEPGDPDDTDDPEYPVMPLSEVPEKGVDCHPED